MSTPPIRSKRLSRPVLAAVVAVCALAATTGCQEAALRQRIGDVAWSQIGVQENPLGSNCNPYSAVMNGGCWEWCSDFAAWVWINAGVPATYGWGPGQLNQSSVSFYKYAVAHGTWHPANSGYVPQMGDAVIFGLNAAGTFSAHVAIVIGPGSPGVNAVNGNADTSVKFLVDQTMTSETNAPISGYASPAI